MSEDNGKEVKTAAPSVSKNGNGSNSYSSYLKSRLEFEYGITYKPKLVEEIRADLDRMNETIEKLKSEGKLPLNSVG